MSQNCPFCPTKNGETPTSWSFSPEGWQTAKRKHDEEHCKKCPCCGSPILKEENK